MDPAVLPAIYIRATTFPWTKTASLEPTRQILTYGKWGEDALVP